MKKILAAIAATFFFATIAHQAQSSEHLGRYPECLNETPLPDFKIVPGTEAVGDAARFLGVWGGGKWGNTLCHTLVVKEVTKSGDGIKASVLYSWGKGFGFSPDYLSTTGEIKNGKLSFTVWRGETKVEYMISPSGALTGTYSRFRVAMDPIRSTVMLWQIKK